MDVLLNPVQPQMIPKQEQKRLQLQKERNEEMKRFLAQQASNSHPRLVKLLKKHENPSTSINSFPNFGSAQEKMQPTRLPMMMSPSLQTSAPESTNIPQCNTILIHTFRHLIIHLYVLKRDFSNL